MQKKYSYYCSNTSHYQKIMFEEFLILINLGLAELKKLMYKSLFIFIYLLKNKTRILGLEQDIFK